MAEKLDRLSDNNKDFGDYFCPHCRYKTLRRGASRCPECHGDPGSAFWERVDTAEMAERRKKQVADEEYRLRMAAQKERVSAEWAAWWPYRYWIALLALLALAAVAILVSHP